VEAAQAGIYVPPGDPKALVDALRYLADHPQERRDMCRRGRLYVEEKFNRAKQSGQFITLLEEVAARR
jgi:glycosyltransferase involved in cell wall biosynthesis